MKTVFLFLILLFSFGLSSEAEEKIKATSHLESIVLGSGCFWGEEKRYEAIPGVVSAVSGYADGKGVKPTYREITKSKNRFNPNNHAEVVLVVFDRNVVSVEEILEDYFEGHDPTQLNRQGNDVGTQYRSAVFYHNEKQRSAAEKSKENLDNSNIFSDQIVTEITALDKFWPAEDYHNDYYKKNPNQPYCRFIIKPKLDKLFKKK